MAHESLTDRQLYAQDAPGVMEELAKSHVENPTNRLMWLPDDPEAHPAQDPFMFNFERPGPRVEVAILDTVATAAEPRFPGIMDALRSDEQSLQSLAATASHLKNGKNIWVVSPHGDILDIAYVVKAGYNVLDDLGHTPRRVLAVVSKALSRVGFELVEGQPPVETIGTLAMQCDDVVMTWPRSKNAKDAVARLPKAESGRHNEQAVEVIDSQFKEGGVFAVMAPTGTTRMEENKEGALLLPTPSDGTIDLLMRPDTLVLPAIAWFKSAKALISMPSEPWEISSPSDIYRMFGFMAEAMTEQIDGYSFAYKAPRRRLGHTALHIPGTSEG